MKLLKTEAQADLLAFFNNLDEGHLSLEQQADVNYWRTELKPKRVHKKKSEESSVSTQENT